MKRKMLIAVWGVCGLLGAVRGVKVPFGAITSLHLYVISLFLISIFILLCNVGVSVIDLVGIATKYVYETGWGTCQKQ